MQERGLWRGSKLMKQSLATSKEKEEERKIQESKNKEMMKDIKQMREEQRNNNKQLKETRQENLMRKMQ